MMLMLCWDSRAAVHKPALFYRHFFQQQLFRWLLLQPQLSHPGALHLCYTLRQTRQGQLGQGGSEFCFRKAFTVYLQMDGW